MLLIGLALQMAHLTRHITYLVLAYFSLHNDSEVFNIHFTFILSFHICTKKEVLSYLWLEMSIFVV